MKQQTVTTVFCTFQLEGIHNWPQCPFAEVAYLRDPHRHVFHFKAHKEVTHSDRDTEFIMLKHAMIKYLQEKYISVFTNLHSTKILEFGAMSCEMIAKELVNEFDLCECEVSEDGENGAIYKVTTSSFHNIFN